MRKRVSAQDEILMLVRRINLAWMQDDPEQLPKDLHDLFHPRMVIRGPGFQKSAEGRGACIASYIDFVTKAEMHECVLSEPVIDVFDSAAVATYQWEIRYTLGGQTFRETGSDILTFVQEDGRWQAIWRAMMPVKRTLET